MGATEETIKTVSDMAGKYDAGFVTDIESDKAPKGLSEDIVRFISAKKKEPEWMLEWRLQAYREWIKMTEPSWANVHYVKPDFQAIKYYSAPKQKVTINSLDEIDPELRSFVDSGRSKLDAIDDLLQKEGP